MFKNTPTSKIIAIKFSLYVVIVLIFFSVIANVLFFRDWFHGESMRVRQSDIVVNQTGIDAFPIWVQWWTWQVGKPPRGKFIRTMWESIPYTDEIYAQLQNNRVFSNLSKLDDEYVLYIRSGDKIKIAVVTRPIESQKAMLGISLVWILFLWILTYLLSRYFVKSSLYRLEKLRLAVTNLDIDNLDIDLPLEWPESDEVRIIGTKLKKSLERIKHQTTALKDFVGNASHELKTPLMQIGWQVDYLLKAKSEYEDWLQSIKKTTKTMNVFIDNLLTLAKIESQDWLKDIPPTDISKLTNNSLQTYSKIYQEKDIELISSVSTGVEKPILPQHFDIIINNLISNAFKYTNSWHITVTLTQDTIIIQDTWIWIHQDNTDKIWDKFRQEDSSKTNRASYWLGLSLVKTTIDLYKWDIQVQSNSTWTTFTITMK